MSSLRLIRELCDTNLYECVKCIFASFPHHMCTSSTIMQFATMHIIKVNIHTIDNKNINDSSRTSSSSLSYRLHSNSTRLEIRWWDLLPWRRRRWGWSADHLFPGWRWRCAQPSRRATWKRWQPTVDQCCRCYS